MRGVHIGFLEHSMQNNVRLELSLSISRRHEVQVNETPIRSGPVELDVALLKHVGGGAPRGTWSPDSGDVVEAPRGTW